MLPFRSCRLTASTSYFQTLPVKITDYDTSQIKFETACSCDKPEDQAVDSRCTNDGIKVDPHVEDSQGKYNRITMCDRNPQKTRKRRDIEGSDELTHEDLEVLMTPFKSNEHHRETRSVVSKDNATRYCSQRLLETKVGKLCANLGTNVQALVDVCSADVAVSFSQS